MGLTECEKTKSGQRHNRAYRGGTKFFTPLIILSRDWDIFEDTVKHAEERHVKILSSMVRGDMFEGTVKHTDEGYLEEDCQKSNRDGKIF